MDIDFHMPTHIIMESEALANRAPLLEAFGTQALLVAGKHSAQESGALEEVSSFLQDSGIRRVLFNPIQGTPTVEQLEAGAALGREAGVDFVIAVGGGAVLDAGKAIALLCASEIGEGTLMPVPHQQSLPLVCIPTTASIGTEVTASILIQTQDQPDALRQIVNPALFPTLALLDARYTLDINNTMSLHMCLETLGRAVDALISENSNPMTDALVISALGMMMDYPEKLNGEETLTLWEREDCMLAANQVGIASATGGNVLEALAVPLSLVRAYPLGVAYGLVLIQILPLLEEQAKFVFRILLNATGLESLEALTRFLTGLLPKVEPLNIVEYERVSNSAVSNLVIQSGILKMDEDSIGHVYAGVGKGYFEEVN